MNKLFHGIGQTLRYASPLPIRILLAIAALLRSIFYLTAQPRIDKAPMYHALMEIMPLEAWGVVFFANFLLLSWRIVDKRPRIGWSRLINSSTCFLWSIYVCANVYTLGFLRPDCSSEIAMMLAATWATLRTDLTNGDRAAA